MATETTAAGRRFTIKVDRHPTFEVRIEGRDRTEPYPSYASAGVGMGQHGNFVLVSADRAETLRELGEALIAAADLIESCGAS